MDTTAVPPGHLLVEENDIQTLVTREFFDSHADTHEWTVVAEADEEPLDPTAPQGKPMPKKKKTT